MHRTPCTNAAVVGSAFRRRTSEDGRLSDPQLARLSAHPEIGRPLRTDIVALAGLGCGNV
jgi:hypothetical protein